MNAENEPSNAQAGSIGMKLYSNLRRQRDLLLVEIEKLKAERNKAAMVERNKYLTKIAIVNQNILWCVAKLKHHREHWAMTKNPNTLPSDDVCRQMIEKLESVSVCQENTPVFPTTQPEALKDALNLVDVGTLKTWDWMGRAAHMCNHCQPSENIDQAAARILAEEVRRLLKLLTNYQNVSN